MPLPLFPDTHVLLPSHLDSVSPTPSLSSRILGISPFKKKKKCNFFYNVVLVSTVQHESAICIHTYPPSWSSHHPPSPTPLGHHSTELSFLCCTAGSHQLAALHTVMHTCQRYSLSSPRPLLPPLCLHVCVSIPALQVFSRRTSRPRDRTWVSRIAGRRFTVWATREASMYIHINIQYLFFFNSSSFHSL